MIMNFITSLRPFGGKNLPSADFAFMSLNINELCNAPQLNKIKRGIKDAEAIYIIYSGYIIKYYKHN